MDQNQALQLLVAAVEKAQSSGVYTLDESAALAQAVAAFRPAEQPEQPTQPELVPDVEEA
tara:strand:- start:303 stop:482 length:180 start_codon:yes stop_codon:yes gene_type:complete